ncbi:hypothetical protein HanRHA438_Chr08g0337941 [Helianthus annuus]|nr:hypothetical protein HanRHA438_Chr08g0337941 [Helianthus annuus]
MVSGSPDGVLITTCFLLHTIWARLCDNQSMPITTSKPANLNGRRDKGKEWFIMDMKHPSNTIEAVSMVPSANSTSYFTLRVLTSIFNNSQNLLSTNDLLAPESNNTLA